MIKLLYIIISIELLHKSINNHKLNYIIIFITMILILNHFLNTKHSFNNTDILNL